MRIVLLLLAPAVANANTIAITEFLNNTAGDEATDEWVELYNYGDIDVDLDGYSLGDEDGSGAILTAVTVPAGGYVIISKDADLFVSNWGVGTSGVDVVTADFGSLSNSADELVLADPAGAILWSLAWANDEDEGYATFLQGDRFDATAWGSQADPGIDRNDYDLGTLNTVGYESGDDTSDAYAITAVNLDVGSPLAGHYTQPSTMSMSSATVAITEVFHDSANAAPLYDGDFVELYNWGGSAVDVSGWVIRDGYGADDSWSIPAGTTIPPEGFLVLTRDPAAFVASWGVGSAGMNVVGDGDLPGFGGSDEVELWDGTGLVWSVAYDDGPGFEGNAIHFTETTWTRRDWGRIGYRDVVFDGEDESGTAGYENGLTAVDPTALSVDLDTASPLLGIWSGITPPPGPLLDISGSCPGTVDLTVGNMSANGSFVLLYSPNPGTAAVPVGPCMGTPSGLAAQGATSVGVFRADADGNWNFSPRLGGPACGVTVQVLDLATCTFTNTAMVP